MKSLTEKILLLPEELVDIIHSYIPNQVILWTCREKYFTHHSLVYNILTIEYDTYIRNILRNDYHILFGVVLRENFNRWTIFKKYRYRQNVYKNYFTFLLEFSRENNAVKCEDLLINHYLEKWPDLNQLDQYTYTNKNRYKKKNWNIGGWTI